MQAHRDNADAIGLRDPDDASDRGRRTELQGDWEHIATIIDRVMERAAARRRGEQ